MITPRTARLLAPLENEVGQQARILVEEGYGAAIFHSLRKVHDERGQRYVAQWTYDGRVRTVDTPACYAQV